MKKQYKIQLPKGKKVTMTNVDFENGVMTVNVELENRKEQKYEPKDGDFVCVKAGYEHIAIFKKEVGEDMYVYANWNMSFSVDQIIINDLASLCRIHDIREIRPATELEKKILINQLSKVNKKWNPATKNIEDVRWRAKKSNPYYYIIGFDNIISTTDERLACDDSRYIANNYFKTRKAAEKVAEQIRNILKSSKEE